jgi:hypothetical protein
MSWFDRSKRHPARKRHGVPEAEADGQAATRLLLDRVRMLETELAQARLDIARLQVELAASVSRQNAFGDLTEQRMDTLHRQIVLELKRAFDLGVAVVETESAVDARLAGLFSGGLDAPVDAARLAMDQILSGQLSVGTLEGALTLYGFRIDRDRARERGDCIDVFAADVGGPGVAVYGPYKRLAPGTYLIEAHLRPAQGAAPPATGEIALDVYSPTLGAPLAAVSVPAEALDEANPLSLRFEWSARLASDLVEIRVHQRSSLPFRLTGFTLRAG